MDRYKNYPVSQDVSKQLKNTNTLYKSFWIKIRSTISHLFKKLIQINSEINFSYNLIRKILRFKKLLFNFVP